MLAFFFFNDTATTEIYTLSLHDALPISAGAGAAAATELPAAGGLDGALAAGRRPVGRRRGLAGGRPGRRDRKSTRLNSSHANISYAVFCLKKKQYHTVERLHSIPSCDCS